jgi:hypothetical protein
MSISNEEFEVLSAQLIAVKTQLYEIKDKSAKDEARSAKGVS